MKKLGTAQYAKILFELTREKSGDALDRALDVFLAFLRDRGASGKISAIVDAFRSLAKEADGIVPVDMTAARELSQPERDAIVLLVTKKPDIRLSVDPSIIGGVVMRAGNTLYDASIKSQLQRLKKELISQ